MPTCSTEQYASPRFGPTSTDHFHPGWYVARPIVIPPRPMVSNFPFSNSITSSGCSNRLRMTSILVKTLSGKFSLPKGHRFLTVLALRAHVNRLLTNRQRCVRTGLVRQSPSDRRICIRKDISNRMCRSRDADASRTDQIALRFKSSTRRKVAVYVRLSDGLIR